MKDRTRQVDLALAFVATFVITLALWPQPSPRQVVHCRAGNSDWKTYSIAVNDPSLAEIKTLLHRWQTPEFDRRYVTAKWQIELAKFYQSAAARPGRKLSIAKQAVRSDSPATFRLSDTVATVSFDMPADAESSERDTAGFQTQQYQAAAVQSAGYEVPIATATGEVDPQSHKLQSQKLATDEQPSATIRHADPEYWAQMIEQAQKSIDATLQRTRNAPVVLEQVRPAGWPALAFHVAILAGLIAACGYMHWLRIAPWNTTCGFTSQSSRVLARVGMFAGVVSFSMICVLTLWI